MLYDGLPGQFRHSLPDDPESRIVAGEAERDVARAERSS